ncbi:TIGR04222 domain-containing membrane protein [Streptomyces beijiangensis]|uniref:TIGR04222 domain-containing membrane protein n=1 Tax=Streptomyces beijiangensis TaxID=163361 RepID=A0A939F9P6_9ACTN|nr:TIGR04222 domain-containing membrane protein [Streptomyces beijiangensis]MBO0514528.1 TIGR04222 domain-containing membrane protein [Streptomyces beijiangensis]
MNALLLLCYLVIGVSSAGLIATTVRARGHASGASVHDLMEVAFLSGGPARVTDTALAGMSEDGRITVGGPGIVAVQRPVAQEPVERAVLAALAEAPSGALHLLRNEVMRSPAVQEIGDGLAARGLMVEPRARRKPAVWGIAQFAGCAIGLPLSIFATVLEFNAVGVGESPFPFVAKVLPALVGGMLTGVVCSAVSGRRVTGSGKAALAAYRAAYAQHPAAAVRVALHGLRALPDPLLQAQLFAAARLGVGRGTTRPSSSSSSHFDPHTSASATPAVVWCGSSTPGGSSCGSSGGGGGSSCGGSSGSSCGGGSGSSCGGSSGSSCGGSSGSSCGSSSGSSCGSSSSS